MIKYNIRNNGPWEYDKFVLNYFNLHNEIMLSTLKLQEEESKNSQINIVYNEILEKNYPAILYKKINYLI
jgi:hypothetical protein